MTTIRKNLTISIVSESQYNQRIDPFPADIFIQPIEIVRQSYFQDKLHVDRGVSGGSTSLRYESLGYVLIWGQKVDNYIFFSLIFQTLCYLRKNPLASVLITTVMRKDIPSEFIIESVAYAIQSAKSDFKDDFDSPCKVTILVPDNCADVLLLKVADMTAATA